MSTTQTPQMTGRQRLTAALHRQPTDRLPWAPLIDGYFISSLPEQGIHLDILAAMRRIGCDIMERHVCNPRDVMEGVSTREEQSGDTSRTWFDTPVGSLYVERRASGRTSYITKNMVQSLDDIRVYTYIARNTFYQPRVEEFLAREAEIGDDGIATPSGNMSPVQELLQHVAGVENTVYLMADYPDEMEELFDAMHQRNLRQYEALAQYPCDVVIDYEDTSTTVMSKNMFVNYSLPAINDYADAMHRAGKLFITHMCGKLTGFIDEVGSGRQDGVDSLCPPETGDLCAWDARARWGSKLIIGGIDPPSLAAMTQQQTVDTVLHLLQQLKDKRGFILSTGDAVPYGTPIGNMEAVSRLLAELGPRALEPDFSLS
ncbi:MAG TPA: hypothetical protein IAA58_12540 [Candidatus Gallacutalibacter stercoravium]|nr:hypothetical protein [Candidatus Gallacutalibacter stercoravium]